MRRQLAAMPVAVVEQDPHGERPRIEDREHVADSVPISGHFSGPGGR